MVKAYVDFVNNVVIEGFVSTIAVSLQYLCEILDPLIIARHEMLPLFEAQPKSWVQNNRTNIISLGGGRLNEEFIQRM